jgi:hypothetical protein
MNRTMKQLVEVAFRLRAWERARGEARVARKPDPQMRAVVREFLRDVVGKATPPGTSLWDGVSEDERHRIARVCVALDWFAKAGCPIVSLDEQTAIGFASSPPPEDMAARDGWPAWCVYGLCVGQGAVLIRHAMTPTDMPEHARPHFLTREGVVPMEAWFSGVPDLGDDDDLAHLTENVGAAITRRPEGLSVAERRPSRQAARKQGLNPDHIPAVEYVIGSELLLRARPDIEPGGENDTTGRSLKVRTVVSAHWTHQVCGPRGSQRRLRWIGSHWRGPEDAPVSVHATKIIGTKPPGSENNDGGDEGGQ